jgi:hypothetical protein
MLICIEDSAWMGEGGSRSPLDNGMARLGAACPKDTFDGTPLHVRSSTQQMSQERLLVCMALQDMHSSYGPTTWTPISCPAFFNSTFVKPFCVTRTSGIVISLPVVCTMTV